MIPQRTLSGECEITTGAFSITKRPPVYTGESAALNVQVSFKFQGVDYALPSGVVAEMYLRYPNTDLMTVAVEMEKSGNTASGVLSAEQTGVAGYPLLVIQLTDIETSSLIVACATAVKVSDVRGDLVIDSRAPSPSEIIYVGRSPYVDPTTKHWMQWNANLAEYVDTEIYSEGKAPYINANTGCWMVWDTATEAYVDSGIVARGLPATFTARATTLPAGSDATASITGTAENPVLNVGVPKGQDSAVLSVNGQTGAVQVNDENVPSSVDGKANVEAVLRYHSQQIDDLQAAVAYVEEGDTSSQTYTEGQFVLWKGLLYTVKTGGMPLNTPISTTYLDPVTIGGLNVLNEYLNTLNSRISRDIIAGPGITFSYQNVVKVGKVCTLFINCTKNTNWAEGDVIGTIPEGFRPFYSMNVMFGSYGDPEKAYIVSINSNNGNITIWNKNPQPGGRIQITTTYIIS